MTNHQQYIQNRVRAGWGLLVLGISLFTVGLALQHVFDVPFNARIISGLGIFFSAVGLAQMFRYRLIQNNRKAAMRLVNTERDERSQMIRARSGNRAFWVSLGLTYAVLMWLSFAASGSLPPPTPDGLWFFLAAAVVIPFVVYVIGIIQGEKNS